jgi:hypothetical protein
MVNFNYYLISKILLIVITNPLHMKRLALFFVVGMFFFLEINAQNTAITDDDAYDPHPSAILDVKSINKGLLMPRLTTAQRNAVFNPATGLLVFDTDEKAFYFYNGSQWLNVSSGAGSGDSWNQNGNTVQLIDSTSKVGIGTNTPIAKLGVKGDVPIDSNEPLLEVVNANGDTVFAVYSTGVRVNVFDDPTGKATGKRGGFAVAGFDQSKGVTKEYLRVTPDSVRVYVDRDSAKATGKRGGFAVAGFDQSKGVAKEYLRVTPDSVRVYVEREISKASGKRGGFAVAGFDQSKGTTQEFMRVTPDSVRVYIGNIAKATGKRGGFAVAGFDQSKGSDSSFLFVGADTTQIATVFKSSNDVVVNTDIYKSTGDFYVPDELATISTGAISDIGRDTAIAWGNITSDGRSEVTSRGICWNTVPNPTTSDNFIASGSGTGEFSGLLNGLVVNTTYYLRAYAVNAVGTAYSNQVQFKYIPPLPTIEPDTSLIPDGLAITYTDILNYIEFTDGQMINSANDITSIFLDIEHSYVGDLDVELVCPNGQSVMLMAQGGGERDLGEPVPDESGAPGNGYLYSFSDTAATTWSSMMTNTDVHDYIDNSGNSITNAQYIPEGFYQPVTNMSNLIGCPLDGDWTLEITDNSGQDDGYVFMWGINFNSGVYP